MNTGLLLHFQSHIDLRLKCLIKTMVHRAKELSSVHQAFVDECRQLKSMFDQLKLFDQLTVYVHNRDEKIKILVLKSFNHCKTYSHASVCEKISAVI